MLRTGWEEETEQSLETVSSVGYLQWSPEKERERESVEVSGAGGWYRKFFSLTLFELCLKYDIHCVQAEQDHTKVIFSKVILLIKAFSLQNDQQAMAIKALKYLSQHLEGCQQALTAVKWVNK